MRATVTDVTPNMGEEFAVAGSGSTHFKGDDDERGLRASARTPNVTLRRNKHRRCVCWQKGADDPVALATSRVCGRRRSGRCVSETADGSSSCCRPRASAWRAGVGRWRWTSNGTTSRRMVRLSSGVSPNSQHKKRETSQCFGPRSIAGLANWDVAVLHLLLLPRRNLVFLCLEFWAG